MAINEGLYTGICETIGDELRSADKKFPDFSSMHEGYAVIREEYEEFMDEISLIGKDAMEDLFDYAKLNDTTAFCKHLEFLSKTAVRACAELIQFCAMVEKGHRLEGK